MTATIDKVSIFYLIISTYPKKRQSSEFRIIDTILYKIFLHNFKQFVQTSKPTFFQIKKIDIKLELNDLMLYISINRYACMLIFFYMQMLTYLMRAAISGTDNGGPSLNLINNI